MPVYIAFIDRRRAEESNVKLEDICGPWQVLGKNLGVVFNINCDQNSAEFTKYAQDPNYFRKPVCGN